MRSCKLRIAGKLNFNTNNISEAIDHFQKVDSIFQITNDLLPETKESYLFLNEYYKNKNDLENQLLYIEKLIQVESVLAENYNYLSKNISSQYDIPILVREKQDIISQLVEEKKYHRKLKYLFIALASITLFFGVYQFYRKRIIWKKFNELMDQSLNLPKTTILNKSTTKNKESDIPEEIVKIILTNLSDFEKNKEYLNSTITLSSLATHLNTNSTYLSKVINIYLGMSFRDYLKKIRVEHALQNLKENKVYSKYSIKAIAKEFGFNSAESFTKAFYREYGIYPSTFIKNLNKAKKMKTR